MLTTEGAADSLRLCISAPDRYTVKQILQLFHPLRPLTRDAPHLDGGPFGPDQAQDGMTWMPDRRYESDMDIVPAARPATTVPLTARGGASNAA